MNVTKITVFILLCFAFHTMADSGDNCKKYIKKHADEADQRAKSVQEQIILMTPVLKNFMWQILELEYKAQEIRESLERLSTGADVNQPREDPQELESEVKSSELSNVFSRRAHTDFATKLIWKLEQAADKS